MFYIKKKQAEDTMKYIYYSNKKGFTLIELLITMAIIGILAGIAIPLYTGQRTKAMIAEAEQNVETLRLAMEQYYNENGCYYKSGGACSTVTLSDVSDIKAVYPAFKPGNTDNLKFDYKITITGGGSNFTAVAEGKTDTAVAGIKVCNDQDNAKECP